MRGEVFMQSTDRSPQVKRWEARCSPDRYIPTPATGITSLRYRLGDLCLADQLLGREGGAVVRDDPNPRLGDSAGSEGLQVGSGRIQL
jgi:hypothetical protein